MSRIGTILAVLVTTGSLGVATSADADRVDLMPAINPSGQSTAGLDIYVNVRDEGDRFAFVFRNDSTVYSSITHVQFHQRLLSFLLPTPSNLWGSDGVSFHHRGSQSHPVLEHALSWPGTFGGLAADWRRDTPLDNGVNDPSAGQAEALTVKFLKRAGATLAELIDELTGSPSLAVLIKGPLDESGQHYRFGALSGLVAPAGPQSQEPVEEPAIETIAVPTPAAAGAGLALLAGLAGARRRR